MIKITSGDYVIFKEGKSYLDDRTHTKFLVTGVTDKFIAIMIPDIGVVGIEKDRLELAKEKENDPIPQD